MQKSIISLFILFSFLIFISNANSNSQGYRDELPELKRFTDLTIGIRRINKGLKYESKGKFKKANKMFKESIDFLQKANKDQDIDPNIFFYLGFAHNKLNNLNDAEIYYLIGQSLDPKHIYINKYLGIFYSEQNKTDEAKKLLSMLKDCSCKEYEDLKKIIKKE